MSGNKTKLIIIRKIISKFIEGLNATGLTAELSPKTHKILKILEPTIFPIAMSACFFLAATTEAANSGKEVPIATTVSPIKAWLRPSEEAMKTELLTMNLPPKNNATTPPVTIKKDVRLPFLEVS